MLNKARFAKLSQPSRKYLPLRPGSLEPVTPFLTCSMSVIENFSPACGNESIICSSGNGWHTAGSAYKCTAASMCAL